MPTSIVIVDDHPVVSHGLRAILEKEPSFSVTGVAPDAKSALKIIEDNKPDIIILDITLPEGDGISLIARILDVHGSAGIIMYTMHDTREYVFRAFRSGALGYVLKGDKIEEIREAVSSVRQQKLF